MTPNPITPITRGAPKGQLLRAGLAAAALAGLALLAAGCGGGSASPGVATVGTTTSQTTPAAASGSKPQSAQKFATCMRSHGEPLFPDPNSQGAINPGSINPNTPQYRNASNACHSLLPQGGNLTTAGGGKPLGAQQQAQMLHYAQCIRAHGVPGFPDPTSHGFQLSPGQVDAKSPQFLSAQQACHSLLPNFGKGGKTVNPGNGP